MNIVNYAISEPRRSNILTHSGIRLGAAQSYKPGTDQLLNRSGYHWLPDNRARVSQEAQARVSREARIKSARRFGPGTARRVRPGIARLGRARLG